MAVTSAGLQTKEKILRVCVRLFLERGYLKTRVVDIVREAGVSVSSFQNLFRAKDGVLTELVHSMYEKQFLIAGSFAGDGVSPVRVYALETAIQITLTELNENLREIYLEAYSHQEALAYINEKTAGVLYGIFGMFQPELGPRDFYLIEFGTAGLMRSLMAQPCSESFTLDEKLRTFLTLSLRCLCVPEEEIRGHVAFVLEQDIRGISQRVMGELFRTLAMQYDFTLPGIS